MNLEDYDDEPDDFSVTEGRRRHRNRPKHRRPTTIQIQENEDDD